MMKIFQHPFPHIVFDDFLQEHIFKSILKNYPAKKDINVKDNNSIWLKEDLVVLSEARRTRFLNE